MMNKLIMNGPFLKTLFYGSDSQKFEQNGINFVAFASGVWMEDVSEDVSDEEEFKALLGVFYMKFYET